MFISNDKYVSWRKHAIPLDQSGNVIFYFVSNLAPICPWEAKFRNNSKQHYQ